MATAGRVLLLLKGDYNSATQYVPLDCVKYQGSTYVCIQTSQNNLPTNTTYFQVLAQGVANAAGLSYDNTNSGLSSNNVQNAIDELNTELGNKANRSELPAHPLIVEFTPTWNPSSEAPGFYFINSLAVTAVDGNLLGATHIDVQVDSLSASLQSFEWGCHKATGSDTWYIECIASGEPDLRIIGYFD